MRKLLITLTTCGLFFVAAPALAAVGTISGTITRATDGTSVASAWVTAQNTDTLAISYGTASAAGIYTIPFIVPGTYDISCSSVSGNSTVMFLKKTITVTVSDGETKTGQDLALGPRGRLIGHIYAADGTTPIAGATMVVSNVGGNSFGYATSTANASGSFTAIPVPTDATQSAVGSYTLTIAKTGYFSASVTGVVLTGDNTDITQDIRLTPASAVSGTIRDTNGAAIANATVAVAKTGGYTYTTATNASGVYTVLVFDSNPYNGSAVGDYTTTISKTGYVTKTGRLSIAADASTLTSQDYALTVGKVFSGTIVDKSSNAALTGAVITLYNRNRTRSSLSDFSYTVTSDGTFSFSSLASGKYRVTITKTGYAMIVLDSLAITADKTGVTYKLELAGSVRGLIYTGKNIPVNGASVAVYAVKNGKEMSYTSTTADDTGNYTVTGLRKGTYKLLVTTTDYVQTIATIKVKNTTAVVKNIKLAVAGSVSGYLTDKVTGLPISGSPFVSVVTIRVIGTSVTAIPDSNGYFILDGIAPGTRKITVTSMNYELPKQLTIKVSAGKIKTGANFSLVPKQ